MNTYKTFFVYRAISGWWFVIFQVKGQKKMRRMPIVFGTFSECKPKVQKTIDRFIAKGYVFDVPLHPFADET